MTAVLEFGLMGQELDVDKIRERRKSFGLSQTEAAEKAGIPGGAAAWHDIESGRRVNVKIETLVKIATALKCDARDLITAPAKSKRKRK
jgi:transcriptional regulator with XRE-family HTH domain